MGKDIRLKDIHKQFITGNEKVQALRDVNLEIKDGEFFTMLGPSGCGKTTLLRCIAGLETPDRGEIAFGTDILFSASPPRVVPPHKRAIGMVFQSYAIWPHMNVYENVAYPLKYGEEKKFSKKEIREKAMASISRVHMETMADRPATQLSGGQQQRVALARALVNDPLVILLDEPLVNLDAKLREEMRIELRELLHSLGTTVVYVTHDQTESLTMSDRIAVLLEGNIVQVGNPSDIYNCPGTEFVADFIGTTNLLSGRVEQGPAAQKVVQTRIGPVCCEGLEELAEREEVKLVIRPEDIQLSRQGEMNQANTLQGVIKGLEFLGDAYTVFVKVGEEILRVKAPSSGRFVVNETVRVEFPAKRCCILGRYSNQA
jgi:iron(III) transport system ATP-binding protein